MISLKAKTYTEIKKKNRRTLPMAQSFRNLSLFIFDDNNMYGRVSV